MVARMMQRLLLAELLLAALISVATFIWSHLPWAVSSISGFVAVILVRLLLTTNHFFMSWRYGSPTPRMHRLTFLQAGILYFREFYASMWNTSWAMPFKAFSGHDIPQANGLPVLLIHGYGNNSGYWQSLSQALVRANITHHTIDLEPVFTDLDDYVPSIHQAIENLCAQNGQDSIIIVAHSMGGVAARAYLRDHGVKRIAQLITLGTPHHGTRVASFGPGINSQQMRWHGDARYGTPSEWLSKLNSEETTAARTRIVSIYSHHDNIVAPQTSSHLEGARNIEYQGIGHVDLALHPLIHARITAEIRNASARVVEEKHGSRQSLE